MAAHKLICYMIIRYNYQSRYKKPRLKGSKTGGTALISLSLPQGGKTGGRSRLSTCETLNLRVSSQMTF